MFRTLYKNTHKIALAVCAATMLVATAAAASLSMLADGSAHGRSIPSVGRFVVTPTGCTFVAPEAAGASKR